MKITNRTIMRMLRLYKLADDTTSVKDFRSLKITPSDDMIHVSLILDKSKYNLFFGPQIDDSDIDDLWPDKPDNATILSNPLDSTAKTTPFRGKYLIILNTPPETQRLDIYLSKEFDSSVSRSLWQKYIKLGCVRVNGVVADTPKLEIKDTDIIDVEFPKRSDAVQDLPVVYIDEDIVAIDKPSGVLTHAKGGINQELTVADFARKYTDFNLDTNRPGIIHRLDRDTSGIIVVARNEKAASTLQKQFADRRAKKVYLAVVEGAPKIPKAKIDLPIARNPSKPSTFRVDSNGKSAETAYETLSSVNNKSLVRLRPKTGRTHQLRVHMSHIGTPIVGDRVYGKPSTRLLLHAYQLTVTLPSGTEKTFTASIPDEILKDFPEIDL